MQIYRGFGIFAGNTSPDMKVELDPEKDISYKDFKEQILQDYRTAVLSRECSILGRREVLTGKAKFGIFGDGK